MASLLWIALLICVAAPSVTGKDVALGDACTAGDACTPPTSTSLEVICDQTGFCKLQNGQACTGGNVDKCVAGAECVSGTCTCKGSTYVDDSAGGSGKCTTSEDNKFLSACPQGTECTGEHLKCDTTATPKVCVCADGAFVPNVTSAACSAKPVTTPPKSSNGPGVTTKTTQATATTPPAAGALGGDCTSVACTDAKWVCDTDTDTKCKLKAGGGCTAANGANCVTGTTCKTDKCVCTLPKVANQTSGLCIDVPAGKMGYPCTTGNKDKNCPSAKHLKCDDVKKECICDTGFSGSRGGDCNSGSAALTSVTSLALVALFWASRHLLKE